MTSKCLFVFGCSLFVDLTPTLPAPPLFIFRTLYRVWVALGRLYCRAVRGVPDRPAFQGGERFLRLSVFPFLSLTVVATIYHRFDRTKMGARGGGRQTWIVA